MSGEYSIRESLVEMENVSRRSFFSGLLKGAGVAVAYDRFGPKLFAQSDPRLPYRIYSALGNIIIPVDDDPGWKTFEPGITNFGVDVFVRQVLLGGIYLAFLGFLNSLAAINEVPVLTTYGPRFLDMNTDAQNRYLSDMLTGQFENDGFGGRSLIVADSIPDLRDTKYNFNDLTSSIRVQGGNPWPHLSASDRTIIIAPGYYRSHLVHNFPEGFLHVFGLVNFVAAVFYIETQYWYTKLIHHIGINFTIIAFQRHGFSPSGHTHTRSPEKAYILF